MSIRSIDVIKDILTSIVMKAAVSPGEVMSVDGSEK